VRQFVVEDQEVGFVMPYIADVLKVYSKVFELNNQSIVLNPNYKTIEERTKIIEETLIDLREKNVFKSLNGWRNEHYNVRSKFSEKTLFTMERAAVGLFGIKAYACNINGYVKKNNEYFLWIAKRADNKQTFPGMLDNLAGGGLTSGLGVVECARKELAEEAGLSEENSKEMKSVGAVSYAYEEEGEGVCIEADFVFDIKLPDDFVPNNKDGEVNEFYLMNMNQVKEAIANDEFMPSSAAITIDFMKRKGILTPDDLPNYLEIMEKLHFPGL